MSFQTPHYSVTNLLEWAASGHLQLPDFQRSYKWDDERIRSLLVTILRGHPMGVLMALEAGGDQVRFKPKPITGASEAKQAPGLLLLDGQQRTTSLFQALSGDGVVDTEDERKKNCGGATSSTSRSRWVTHVTRTTRSVPSQPTAGSPRTSARTS